MEVSVERLAVRMKTGLGDEEDGVPSCGLGHRRGRRRHNRSQLRQLPLLQPSQSVPRHSRRGVLLCSTRSPLRWYSPFVQCYPDANAFSYFSHRQCCVSLCKAQCLPTICRVGKSFVQRASDFPSKTSPPWNSLRHTLFSHKRMFH